jgi:hypothetical protein
METGKVYSFIDLVDSIELKNDIFTYFDLILAIASTEALSWNKYNTRHGTRYVNEIAINQGIYTRLTIPVCFADISDIISKIVFQLLQVARSTITDGSELIGLQIYLCYYRDGQDVCPMHSHSCRQLTLSVGDDRIMTVRAKKINLYNGSIIYLHKEKHGIPKCEPNKSTNGPRLSFNLFYTTSNEQEPVN